MIRNLFAIAAYSAALIAAPAEAAMSPLRKTVIAFYAANDLVQAAIANDVCANQDFMTIDDTAGRALTGKNRRSYNRIGNLYLAAGGRTNGTDGALQQMHDSFCEAVSNR